MFRTTQDIVELRRWAEFREARPCRDTRTGQLQLSLPGGPGEGFEVGWDEFEPAFVHARQVFVYDDAPGSRRCFIGAAAEAEVFVCGPRGAPAP
jgi:hypothetical protein